MVSRSPWALRGLSSGLVLALVLSALVLGAGGMARASDYPAVTGTITGPAVVGESLTADYVVNGTGGPAEAANGTLVGNITFNATLSGNNVSTALIQPPTGVLINGSEILRFTAPCLVEVVTLRVELTSSYAGTNVSANITTQIRVVAPYVLAGTLYSGTTTVNAFNMTVTLDGVAVGQVSIPTLSAETSHAFSFDYVTASLAPGWHTLSVSLAEEHGFVTFTGGVQQYSVRFYIAGAPPDESLDIGVGIAAFALAVFIWGTVVGARRQGRRPGNR